MKALKNLQFILFSHLEQLDAKNLLVLDRGYLARWLIAHLVQRGIAFCSDAIKRVLLL